VDRETGTFRVKSGLAEMLKGGVIMDVTNAEQAKIAEDAGAVAVMALERVPSDIRKDGGVARMSPVKKIQEIQKTVRQKLGIHRELCLAARASHIQVFAVFQSHGRILLPLAQKIGGTMFRAPEVI
jgi:pyridoxal biosynthesis lyase PdxS